MHRAAGGVATGLGQRQGLLVHALAAKGGIAMHQHWQHLLALGVGAPIHACAHRALDHGVDDLQVRGVKGQRQMHRAARRAHVRAKALVVFHVTRSKLFWCGMVEFSKQVLGLLAHGIDQHVEAAPVRHADHDLLHALAACSLNQFVHGGNKTLAAF